MLAHCDECGKRMRPDEMRTTPGPPRAILCQPCYSSWLLATVSR